jgi:hypothetical protein
VSFFCMLKVYFYLKKINAEILIIYLFKKKMSFITSTGSLRQLKSQTYQWILKSSSSFHSGSNDVVDLRVICCYQKETRNL